MKKFFILCLTVFSLFIINLSNSLVSAEGGYYNYNDMYFVDYEDEHPESIDTVILLNYYGDNKDVVVPETVEGKRVYAVSKSAFQENTNIESVKLPKTVRAIEDMAFYGCTNLKRLNLGGLQYPLNEIGGYSMLLSQCNNLERLEMSDEANFPMLIYDSNSFYKLMTREVLDNLKYIYIGSHMSRVDKGLFYGNSLENVDIGEGNPLYKSINGVVYSSDMKELLVCGSSYKNSYYEIPEEVEKINSIGFESCKNLKKVKVPESLKEIGSNKFWGLSVTLIVKKNSFAHKYAYENDIPFQLDGEASTNNTVHLWSESYTIDQEATCQKEGKKSIHCLLCNKIKDGSHITINKIKHNYATVVNKATLSENGLISQQCTYCHDTINQIIYSPKTVVLSQNNFIYNGKQQRPTVQIRDSQGIEIHPTNYNVIYIGESKDVNEYGIKIVFKNNYTGHMIKSYRISKRNLSTLSYSKVTNKTYTGKQIKPSITVKDGKKTLKNGKDYTLSYKNNKNTGKATITIKGKGNYSGSKTINFYIVPKKVTISSVKPGKKQLTVKYKKVTGASGYQIAYSTSKSKGFKYITVNAKTVSKVIKKLKSKKNYFIKVRAYKTVGKKKYYGAYSAIKSTKVK